MYDFANSAFATSISAVLFNKYFAGVVAGGERGIILNLKLFSIHLPGSAFFNFTVAAAMVIVAVSAPVLGAIADFSGAKKKFLLVYCYGACLFTGLLYFIHEGDYVLGALFYILAIVGFAGGEAFYNAFLPEISAPDDMGWVSGLGWAIGYIGGGLCLLLNLIMLNYPELLGFPPGTFTIHDCFLSVAVWWGIFALPIFFLLREKAEKRIKPHDKTYIRIAFQQLRKTFKKVRRYRELSKFLLAFLIYNDGIQTVIIMTSIFGDQELNISTDSLIFFFLMVQATAFFGAIVFGYAADILRSRRTILITLIVWFIVVLWAFFIGFTGDPIAEFWALGVLAGLVLGGSQAASRSLQGEFTPLANSAEFFGFYTIAGRFASIFGPAIFGVITWLTGSLRMSILSLIIFFLTGFILLLFVDDNKGRQEASLSIDD